MMSDAELAELAKDIKENGLLERIVIHDGMILDGRNRLKACELAGAEPLFCNPQPPVTSPTIYVISKNLHRRHLTTSQRAAIAAEVIPLIQAERAAQPRRTDGTFSPLPTIAVSGRSSHIAAQAVGVNERTVERAKAIKDSDPEAFERVKRGELTVNAAAAGCKEPPKIGGHQAKDVSTRRGTIRAEAHKRRMVTVLSESKGMSDGLLTLDAALIAAVCTPRELDIWATKAEHNARNFRKFATTLRSFINGESQQGPSREDASRLTDDSSDRTAGTENESCQSYS